MTQRKTPNLSVPHRNVLLRGLRCEGDRLRSLLRLYRSDATRHLADYQHSQQRLAIVQKQADEFSQTLRGLGLTAADLGEPIE